MMWGELHVSRSGVFIKSHDLSDGLATITDHRGKLEALYRRATKLIPSFEEERQLLGIQGYSSGEVGREFTGVVETIVCELYSCLDGLKKTIYAIYRNVRGVQKKSTEKLFKNAVEKKYGDELPVAIVTLLEVAYTSWFPDLRRLRTELTHGRIGACSIHIDDKRISYTHYGMRAKNNVFIIEDITAWVNTIGSSVNELLDRVCMFWFQQLEPRNVIEPCGVHQGRLLIRAIKVTEPLDQNSGLCLFRHAFEEDLSWVCPLTDTCSAYERVGSRSKEVLERLTSDTRE